MDDTNKKIKKLKRTNIILVIVTISIFLALFLILFLIAYQIFGGPIFDGPFDTYSTRWYSKSPKIELIMGDVNSEEFNEFDEHPITITINGQEETYYLYINKPQRQFYISKGWNSKKALRGHCSFRLDKFVMKISECNDDKFASYDKIILKRDLWYGPIITFPEFIQGGIL
jgi:hypothetical protein